MMCQARFFLDIAGYCSRWETLCTSISSKCVFLDFLGVAIIYNLNSFLNTLMYLQCTFNVPSMSLLTKYFHKSIRRPSVILQIRLGFLTKYHICVQNIPLHYIITRGLHVIRNPNFGMSFRKSFNFINSPNTGLNVFFTVIFLWEIWNKM
jgi:hypothetical protein